MIHILLLVLKIIGVILLILIGIVFVLLMLVLAVPAKYQVFAETEGGMEKLKLQAKASWLCNLLCARVTYYEKETQKDVRIVFVKLGKRKTKRNTEAVKSESDGGNSGKIKKFLKELLTEEKHLAALQKIKEEIVVLAKHIRPRKLKGYVKFGFDDPYRTGQVLAVLSVLYPIYGERIEIYPDFEREILEGKIEMKGYISVTKLLFIIYRLYTNKDVYNLFKK